MLQREDIEEVIAQAADKEKFRDILSNHFEDLNEPCSVSLGIDITGVKVSDIVQVLRNSGINAVGYYEAGVENPACFVVDGTGIKTPFMKPQDTLQATLDIYNSLAVDGIEIRGYALPSFRENLVFAKAAESSSVIDVAENTGKDRDKTKIFIEGMLATMEHMPSVDVKQIDEKNADRKMLFRGGLLGDEPYAVVSSRRGRDVGYATPYLENAVKYADGTFSLGVHYKKVDGKSYGFVYAFEAAEEQKYFTAYGIERRGKVEGIRLKKGEEDPYYETPLFKHRNPFVGIYLKYEDKLVLIGNKNGYLSKAWEEFAKLHNACSSFEKNDRMVERANRQKNEKKIYSYQNIKNGTSEGKISDLSEKEQLEGYVYSSNIRSLDGRAGYVVQNAQMLCVDLPEVFNKAVFAGDVKLENCSFSTSNGVLDLSRCDGNVSLENCDLSGFKEIVFPKQCKTFYLGGVKFPPDMEMLDLSKVQCQKSLVFGNQDMSDFQVLCMPDKQPERVKFWGINQMSCKVYGMGAVDKDCLASMDFSGTELLEVKDENSRDLFRGKVKTVFVSPCDEAISQKIGQLRTKLKLGKEEKSENIYSQEVSLTTILQNKNAQSR